MVKTMDRLNGAFYDVGGLNSSSGTGQGHYNLFEASGEKKKQ